MLQETAVHTDAVAETKSQVAVVIHCGASHMQPIELLPLDQIQVSDPADSHIVMGQCSCRMKQELKMINLTASLPE